MASGAVGLKMGKNKGMLFGIVLLLLMPVLSLSYSAAPPVQLSSYLSSYVPNAVISNSTYYYNQTLNSNTYTVMYTPSGNYIVLERQGSGYSFVTNVSTVQDVLTPLFVKLFYPNATVLANLGTMMKSYQSQSSGPLADCLTETGLANPGATCTMSNSCQSCSSIPVCKKVLSATGGPSGTFAVGIANFSAEYSQLNSSYNQYFSLLSAINSSNINTNIAGMQGDISTISTLSSQIPHNPIFPLPSGFNPEQLSVCPNYPVLSQAPWYCTAVGFCMAVSFNSTILGNIKASLQSLQGLPISGSTIHAYSENASLAANSYIMAKSRAENYTMFNKTLDVLLPIYNKAVDNASSAYNKTQSKSILLALQSLKSAFTSFQSAGPNQNVIKANALITSLISNLTNIGGKESAVYTEMSVLAENNTIAVLKAEYNYAHIPKALAILASNEQNLNKLVLGQNINVSASNSMIANLETVQSGLKAFGGSSSPMAAFVKSSDGGFVTAVLSVLNMPVQEKIGLAPAVASIEALIIGVILLIIIYVLPYGRVKRHHHHLNKRVSKSWHLLFAALLLILLVYVYLTYMYVASANSFLPLNYFNGMLSSSRHVYLITNGSESYNTQLQQCLSTLKTKFSAAGINATEITGSGYSCAMVDSYGDNLTGQECYGNLLSTGLPAIQFVGENATFEYSGMYGNVAHVGMGLAYGSSCYISDMVKP